MSLVVALLTGGITWVPQNEHFKGVPSIAEGMNCEGIGIYALNRLFKEIKLGKGKVILSSRFL